MLYKGGVILVEDFKVENVVASVTLHMDIPLEKMAMSLVNTEYNPEQFPGAVFRLVKPKTATLLFRTGKMVCTGSKSADMAKKAVKTVVENLREKKIKSYRIYFHIIF